MTTSGPFSPPRPEVTQSLAALDDVAVVQPCKVRLPRSSRALLTIVVLSACRPPALDTRDTVVIPEGEFWAGSTIEERVQTLAAIDSTHIRTDDAALWLNAERFSHKAHLAAFQIMVRPVTQLEYWDYVVQTGAAEPWIDRANWDAQDTGYSYEIVERFAWAKGHPARDDYDHPVVLVSQTEARDYCRWWGHLRGGRGDLPTELQWEKAARGTDGRSYPWGQGFNAARVNTLESGRGSTVHVAAQPENVSPFGVLDTAGNVFEWTRTPTTWTESIVKGGAWNSVALTARASARHARPTSTRHVTIGFRCVLTSGTSSEYPRTIEPRRWLEER